MEDTKLNHNGSPRRKKKRENLIFFFWGMFELRHFRKNFGRLCQFIVGVVNKSGIVWDPLLQSNTFEASEAQKKLSQPRMEPFRRILGGLRGGTANKRLQL